LRQYCSKLWLHIARLHQATLTTVCRGVALVPRSGRWRTTFKHKSHRYCLGTFGTAEEAAHVWDLAAIKSRGPDYQGLNFPRESYAYEMELLDKYSLEQTLHMLKVKLINAKRSGRAVKRKLDSALEEERATPGCASTDTAVPPEHTASRSSARKGKLSDARSTPRDAERNPFNKPTYTAKRAAASQSQPSSSMHENNSDDQGSEHAAQYRSRCAH
jgi:AP2 domain